MSPSQDATDVRYRPMWWLYGTGFALFVIGMGIVIVSRYSGPARPWDKVGLVVEILSGFAFLIIPGALLVARHPWGDGVRLLAERHYAHPRLYGLVAVWAGLVLSVSMGALMFAPDPVSAPGYVTLAELLVALTPVFAFLLFDRRR